MLIPKPKMERPCIQIQNWFARIPQIAELADRSELSQFARSAESASSAICIIIQMINLLFETIGRLEFLIR